MNRHLMAAITVAALVIAPSAAADSTVPRALVKQNKKLKVENRKTYKQLVGSLETTIDAAKSEDQLLMLDRVWFDGDCDGSNRYVRSGSGRYTEFMSQDCSTDDTATPWWEVKPATRAAFKKQNKRLKARIAALAAANAKPGPAQVDMIATDDELYYQVAMRVMIAGVIDPCAQGHLLAFDWDTAYGDGWSTISYDYAFCPSRSSR